MDADLTVILITANEMPARWAEYQLGHLLAASEGLPLISISRQPMAVGRNLLQEGERNYQVIYREMLRGARMAETPFVAVAEDDVLYPREHFTAFRPPAGHVSYNLCRWSLYAWYPLFHFRTGARNCAMIGDRKAVVGALEERERQHPGGVSARMTGEIGREVVERRLRVPPTPCVEWWSQTALVQFYHPTGTDDGTYGTHRDGRRLVKPIGRLKAMEIPHWGRAEDVVRAYDGG